MLVAEASKRSDAPVKAAPDKGPMSIAVAAKVNAARELARRLQEEKQAAAAAAAGTFQVGNSALAMLPHARMALGHVPPMRRH